MRLLEHLSTDKVGQTLDIYANRRAVRSRYSRFRMVCAGADLCQQYNFVLRGYSFGRQCYPETCALLDKLRVQFDICYRNGAQMDGAGVSQILYQLLDYSRLYNCIREYR